MEDEGGIGWEKIGMIIFVAISIIVLLALLILAVT